MKKQVGIGIGISAVLVGGVILAFSMLHSRLQPKPEEPVVTERFALSEEMYEEAGLVDITAEEYADLVATKKSFVVVMHMVICPAEFPVRDVAKQLANEDGVRIYGLVEEEFKKTTLAQEVKYLPSMAIIREGELVDYLDAEADEDLLVYKTVEELRKWLGRWVERI